MYRRKIWQRKSDLYFCQMEKYIADYKKAKKDLSKPIKRMLVTYSTLQYFEKEIGL